MMTNYQTACGFYNRLKVQWEHFQKLYRIEEEIGGEMYASDSPVFRLCLYTPSTKTIVVEVDIQMDLISDWNGPDSIRAMHALICAFREAAERSSC